MPGARAPRGRHPASWLPDPRPLAAAALAPLRARGVVALVARTPTHRLGGVAAAVTLDAPAAAVAATLRDPASWRAFPGWETIRVRPGPNGPGADVEDNLPLVDLDAGWTAEPAGALRWVATAGATRGARLGWDVTPDAAGSFGSIAALTLYPRLEATGTVGRRFITAEPLLEDGLSLALAFADAASLKAALVTFTLIRPASKIRGGYRTALRRDFEAAVACDGQKSRTMMGTGLAPPESHATRRLARGIPLGPLLHRQQ